LVGSSNRVQRYYDGFDEWGRLEAPEGRLELERALELLDRNLVPKSEVLDLGGGPGRYAIELCKRGHSVHLADLSPRQIEVARARIREAGVDDRILGTDVLDARDLSGIESDRFDAVVAFGPFYHLVTPESREQAAEEIRRVSRTGGLTFVAFVPRLAGLRGLLVRAGWDPDQVTPDVLARVRSDGVFENATDRGFQQGYYPDPDEFRAFFERSGFETLDLVSLRGLAADFHSAWKAVGQKAPETERAFREILEASARDPGVISLCGHALLILRTG